MPTYYYGVREVIHHSKHRTIPNHRFEAFILRRKEEVVKQVPDDAIICKEIICDNPEDLKKITQNMLYELIRENETSPIASDSLSAEISVGSVAIHDDGLGCHHSIILDVPTQSSAWALFFNSKPHVKSRRATQEEIALAGFVSSKPTYLNLVLRSVSDFFPCGITFPEHRIQSLRKEYLRQ